MHAADKRMKSYKIIRIHNLTADLLQHVVESIVVALCVHLKAPVLSIMPLLSVQLTDDAPWTVACVPE
jgi:hypothetical protein